MHQIVRQQIVQGSSTHKALSGERVRPPSPRPGAAARLRLLWFVTIAALRDWPLPNPDQPS